MWLHFHHSANMPSWAVIPKYPLPATAATTCTLPAWHAHMSSHHHIPIHFLIRIFISPEQENKLQEAEKCTALKQLKRSWRHFSVPIPSALPLQLQFALKAKEADMLENTFCFMSGENRAGAVSGEARAWGCGEFTVNNSKPLAPFSIVTQSEAAVTSKTDCFQNCS